MAGQKPFKFVVTDGDPRQPRTGANITNETNTSTAPSAAEVAEKKQAEYAAYQQQNKRLLERIEAKARENPERHGYPQTRWLSPDDIRN